MDHLQQAKFHLDHAITAEWKADLHTLCGIGHALVALVEQLQHTGDDVKAVQTISEAVFLVKAESDE